jgi:hypothetical protein
MEAKPFDLAVRNQAKRALEEKHGGLVNAWIVMNDAGFIMACTEEALNLFGLEADQVLGQTADRVLGVPIREGSLVDTKFGMKELVVALLENYQVVGFVEIEPEAAGLVVSGSERASEHQAGVTRNLGRNREQETQVKVPEAFLSSLMALARELSLCQTPFDAGSVLDDLGSELFQGARGFIVVRHLAGYRVLSQWPTDASPLVKPFFQSTSFDRLMIGIPIELSPRQNLPFLMGKVTVCGWVRDGTIQLVVGIESHEMCDEIVLFASTVAGHLPKGVFTPDESR